MRSVNPSAAGGGDAAGPRGEDGHGSEERCTEVLPQLLSTAAAIAREIAA